MSVIALVIVIFHCFDIMSRIVPVTEDALEQFRNQSTPKNTQNNTKFAVTQYEYWRKSDSWQGHIHSEKLQEKSLDILTPKV